MGVPTLDTTKSVLLIGGVAIVAYLGYKAYRGVQSAAQVVPGYVSGAYQTARNQYADQLRAAQAAGPIGGLGPTPDQLQGWINSISSWWGGDETEAVYNDWESEFGFVEPKGFAQLSVEMAKPSYGRLSQPNGGLPR